MNTARDYTPEEGWGPVDWAAKLRALVQHSQFSTVMLPKGSAERLADELDRLYAIENEVHAELLRAESVQVGDGWLNVVGIDRQTDESLSLLRQRGLIETNEAGLVRVREVPA